MSYRKAMREVSRMWAARVLDAIGPLLESATAERADAKETELEKFARVASRPANDAVGTTNARARVREELRKIKVQAKDSGHKQGRLVDTIAGKVDQHNAAEFQRVIGIDANQLGGGVAGLLDDWRAENIDLITSIPETLLDQVSDVFTKMWDSGARVETIRDALQERFGVSESRAELIARDQTLKLNGQLASSRQQAAGITKYTWVTSSDERVRGNPGGMYPNPSKTGRIVSDHFHLNGQTFTYGQPPITNDATGDRNEPGQDFQCRCTASPVLSFLDDD